MDSSGRNHVNRQTGLYILGACLIILSFWISFNALRQTRLAVPGETAGQALRSLLFGRPVLRWQVCPPQVHERYTVMGPDGEMYPTWHPPVDLQAGCYFDHEHGSDPRSYLGFLHSGLPPFGYPAAQAGFEEPHAGYKVFVTNDDLNGRAWMIVLNQDTSQPGRASRQHHSLDWHISSRSGEPLVHLQVMADFGRSFANCSGEVIFATGQEAGSASRLLPTTTCAPDNSYEAWTASVNVGGVFRAAPYFEVDNPVSAVDPADPDSFLPMCTFRSGAESCAGGGLWNGSRRGILRPGQWVSNPGPEIFTTDAYGKPAPEGGPGTIQQFVTLEGWDSRQCCGAEVVFRIQTYSGGVYIAAPPEPAGSVEFAVWK
jgi:hypothetical protein